MNPARATDWRQTESKPCGNCAVTMRPRPTDKPSDWDKRQTCSYACGTAYGNKRKTFDLLCPFCGAHPKRRGSNGKLRDTCGSRECRSAARLTKPETEYHWPKITAKDEADFYGQNREPGDGGFGARILRHHEPRSYGVGSAWMA